MATVMTGSVPNLACGIVISSGWSWEVSERRSSLQDRAPCHPYTAADEWQAPSGTSETSGQIADTRCKQGSYRPWKVLEFYCAEFQALESPEIINQRFWNF